MLGLEIIVVLGVSLLVCGLVSQRTGLAAPVPLLVCGLLAGFVPALRGAHLPPETVLLIFLPALLYWESITTSLREIRRMLRAITLMSIGLVGATAAIVACVAHQMNVPWGPAWVLGAALAPTDATAIAALARGLPRRNLTVLRAESLVNDGSALVIYGLAVGVTTGHDHLGGGHVAGLFVLSYAGGIAAGVAVALTVWQLRVRLGTAEDPLQDNVANVLTPFAAFLVAEAVHASGVLAVVVCGLIMSQKGPHFGRADARQQNFAFWSLATYLLNGALFVLIGLEAQSAVRDLTSVALTRGIALVLIISVAIVVTRFAWIFTTTAIIRTVDRRPQQRALRAPARSRALSACLGFRGAVSLAAALAVPHTVKSGAPFPDRDLIVFVTAGVIVVTLAQSLLMPRLIRWARLPYDSSVDDERHLAELESATGVLEALDQLATELETDPQVTDRVRHEIEKRIRLLRAGETPSEDSDRMVRYHDDYTALHLATVAHKRNTVVRLRDEQRIDDTVLRQLQSRLDLEEIRLSAPQRVD